MDLYIVRHGIALDVGEGGITRDEDRTLSPEGREKVGQAAGGLACLMCSPERVATSPLPRSAETARIIADVVCPGVSVEECEFLRPGAATRDVVDWLCRGGAASAMIVGHMPDVADIASELLTDGPLDMVFKKSAACCIAFSGEPAAGQGRLEWLMQPRALRAVVEQPD